MPMPSLPVVAFRDRRFTSFDLDSLIGSYIDITERGLRKKELSTYVAITNQLFDFLEALNYEMEALRKKKSQGAHKLSYEIELSDGNVSLHLTLSTRQFHHFQHRLTHYRNKIHAQVLHFHALSDAIDQSIGLDIQTTGERPLEYGGVLLMQGDYKKAWNSFEFIPSKIPEEKRSFERRQYLPTPFLSLEAAKKYLAENLEFGRFVAIAQNTREYPLEQTALPLAAKKLESRLTQYSYQ